MIQAFHGFQDGGIHIEGPGAGGAIQRLEERLQFAANRAGRDRAIDLQGHRQRGAGMRFEEYLQNDRTSRGRLVDSFLCGITRQDWQRG